MRGEANHERLARKLVGDLDTIVQKATHKEPTRRYASVEQLIVDFQAVCSSFDWRWTDETDSR
jgi:hypothetical protein